MIPRVFAGAAAVALLLTACGHRPSDATHGRAYPLHTQIVATTFWVGEQFDAHLADGSQVCSTYDDEWARHWSGIDRGELPDDAAGCAGSTVGGCDGVWTKDRCVTEKRTAAHHYFPTAAEPRENPFYLDLPYDDLNDPKGFAKRCDVIGWAHDKGYDGRCGDETFSFMKNRWVSIKGPNGKTCYGQIEDAGPSHDDEYHDASYVFGRHDARPAQRHFNNAGLDVSPALNGCLGFAELNGDSDTVDWRFADEEDVPDGPWTRVVTDSGVTSG
ncbi:MAG TPA: hypothetical protein VE172_10270 [Stackebrandtia sp.]|jgi:hypothetical protein|uniref:hypothetical protein n=1 Tax=Stackebrandtia sp. TaxID=2023065 RepID=UPI002D5DF34B|nr:hypothetical protein [Stackebrandtia sp.]HZE39183.1 hypothetical protein [Stackebrandtia sp.]